MDLRGNIRRSSNGLDIAFPHKGSWHNLDEGPIKQHIERMYEFLLSDEDSRTIFGRVVRKRSFVKNSETRTIVSIQTVIGKIELNRYSKDSNGYNTPSDKVSVIIDIPTTRGASMNAFQETSGF